MCVASRYDGRMPACGLRRDAAGCLPSRRAARDSKDSTACFFIYIVVKSQRAQQQQASSGPRRKIWLTPTNPSELTLLRAFIFTSFLYSNSVSPLHLSPVMSVRPPGPKWGSDSVVDQSLPHTPIHLIRPASCRTRRRRRSGPAAPPIAPAHGEWVDGWLVICSVAERLIDQRVCVQ